MKKQLLLFAALGAAYFGVSASPITQEQALERAFAQRGNMMKSRASFAFSRAIESKDGLTSAFVFTKTGGKGFALLSADDNLPPVLGYSDSAIIDVDNLPPAMQWWLSQFAAKAVTLEKNGNTDAKVNAPADWKEIQPMLKTKWNQDAPYNNEAPVINGYKSPTGCVATSMAQVMNYFKFPEKGRGKVSYNDAGANRSLQFNQKAFDWDNMLDSYLGDGYTEVQADAVSYLMKACGYSVEMNYGAMSSGAQSYKLVNALVNYFKYDPNLYYTERELYSADQWTKMIYDNLVECGPVIYDGSSMQGGHSFVCDGYDGNGYFHFNWGWGGMSDGYYLLDNLNPESQGIGGSDGGFNASQGVVLGIRKPKGYLDPIYDKMKILGSTTATLNGSEILFGAEGSANNGWMNGSYADIRCYVGAIFTKVGSDEVVENVTGNLRAKNGSFDKSAVALSPYQYFSAETLNIAVPIPEGLQDGQYKVTLATQGTSDGNLPWVPMLVNYGLANYSYLDIANGVASVKNGAANRLTVDNAKLDSPLYMGRRSKLVTTLENKTPDQLTICYSPVLVKDNVVQFTGDYMLASVDPGQTVDVTSVVQFYKAENGTAAAYETYELKLLNVDTGEFIGPFESYELEYSPSNLKVTLEDLSVVGAEVKDIVVGDRTFQNTYIIDNSDNCEVHFAYKVTRGYLDSNVRLVLSEYVPSTNSWNVFEKDLYQDNPFAGQGEQEEVTVKADFKGKDFGSVYQIRAAYLDGGSHKSMGNVYVAFNTSGVDAIEVEENEDVEYFNMQGIRVDRPQKGMTLIRKVGSSAKVIVY